MELQRLQDVPLWPVVAVFVVPQSGIVSMLVDPGTILAVRKERADW